jgi:hypothetical protein
MKVHLKIEGLPQLYKTLHRKKDLDVEFPGSTLRDFVNGLIQKYGPGVKQAILDRQGEIDMELRVAVNFKQFLSYGERMDTLLHDGDVLHLMTVG